jgi:integrase
MGQKRLQVQADYYVFPVSGVYYVKFRDPVTRELLSKISSGLRNKSLATQWAQQEWEHRVIDYNKAEVSFRDYAAPFFTAENCPHVAQLKAKGKRLAVKTRRNYRTYLDRHILTDPIADKGLAYIKRGDVIAFRERLNAKLGYIRTAQLVLQAFKVIIHTALDAGVIDTDPVNRITTSVANKQVRVATNIEGIKKVFDHQNWSNPRLRLAIMMAGVAGLRAGEVRALKWKDIDAVHDTISIDRGIVDLEGVKAPKWEKRRVAPYSDVLKNQLERFRANDEDWVFAISDKGPLSYKRLHEAMATAVEKAGLGKLTIHGLRHSIQTALRGRGVNPELLRATFGWVTEDTQEIYTHRELYNLTPQKEMTDELFEDPKPEPRSRRPKRVRPKVHRGYH